MDLIREIIVPTENNYTIWFPDEMIGKQVEVIAFEIAKDKKKKKRSKIERLQDSLKDLRVDLSSFKFNRDEANNYDE